MALVVNNSLANLLDERFNKIYTNERMSIEDMWTKVVARVEDGPPGHDYRAAHLSGLQQLQSVPEGSPVGYVVPAEGHSTTRTYTQLGLGFQVTKIALKDDLTGILNRMPRALARSVQYSLEVEFWDEFNSGFTTATCRDGLSTFHTAHTLLNSGETTGNRTTAALSETALEAAKEYYMALVDDQNFPINVPPSDFLLVYPTALEGTAKVVVESVLKPGSANNDINQVNGEGFQRMAVPYLTDSNNWFVMARGMLAEDSLTWLWKERPDFESSDDFSTGNSLHKVLTRFTHFVEEWRPLYGAIVS